MGEEVLSHSFISIQTEQTLFAILISLGFGGNSASLKLDLLFPCVPKYRSRCSALHTHKLGKLPGMKSCKVTLRIEQMKLERDL